MYFVTKAMPINNIIGKYHNNVATGKLHSFISHEQLLINSLGGRHMHVGRGVGT